MRHQDEFIERQIAIGLIVSADYHDRIRRVWNPMLLESPELRTVAKWCTEYYEKYGRAPDRDIESIYVEHTDSGRLSKADARYIEELLAGLSDEYGRDSQFNTPYLYDKTVQYFKAQELHQHNQEVQALIQLGRVQEAEDMARNYRPTIRDDTDTGIDLSSDEALKRVERAFDQTRQHVVTYPGALGDMWNPHLTRGSFFSLLAPEKRGKSMLMMEIALRATRQKANVAYFEAGDMTEAQVLRRMCVYIAKQGDNEASCRERFRPVGDCVFNQLDLCSREDRNCDHGVFDVSLREFDTQMASFVNIEALKEAFTEHPEYEPCKAYGCHKRRGTPWLTKVDRTRPLTVDDAKKHMARFFKRYRRRFKFVTYPAGTLTVTEMRRALDDWERYDGFVPDVIIVDYADLLSADDGQVKDFRHRQDHVWKSLRALSQERHALLITATQADAESYKKGRLSISNFSEDKRKLAHVTAQFGLNHDPQGREKRLGLLRINEIVVREAFFSADNEVVVLQDLSINRPYLESYQLKHHAE